MTNTLKRQARRAKDRILFRVLGSRRYWNWRIKRGGNSGEGSYGRLATFKAEFLNKFVADHQIETVIEFGCGDGAQLALATYPKYIGTDVAKATVARCRALYRGDPSKTFVVHDAGKDPRMSRVADLALSLDVTYHCTEQRVFEAYMEQLFDASTRWVILYTSNDQRVSPVPHIKHRVVTDWVLQHRPGWELVDAVPNRYPLSLDDGGETSFADFYVFRMKDSAA